MGEAWHVCNQSFILELWAQILPSQPVDEHHVRHFRVRSELNWNQKFIILVDLIQQLVETGPLFGCGKLLCSFIDIFVFAFFLWFLVFEFMFLFFCSALKKGGIEPTGDKTYQVGNLRWNCSWFFFTLRGFLKHRVSPDLFQKAAFCSWCNPDCMNWCPLSEQQSVYALPCFVQTVVCLFSQTRPQLLSLFPLAFLRFPALGISGNKCCFFLFNLTLSQHSYLFLLPFSSTSHLRYVFFHLAVSLSKSCVPTLGSGKKQILPARGVGKEHVFSLIHQWKSVNRWMQ